MFLINMYRLHARNYMHLSSMTPNDVINSLVFKINKVEN